jgi:hypothetical protein
MHGRYLPLFLFLKTEEASGGIFPSTRLKCFDSDNFLVSGYFPFLFLKKSMPVSNKK